LEIPAKPENANERECFFDQLVSLNKIPKKMLDKSVHQYYKDLYISAIWAIVNIYDFNDNYSDLAKKVYLLFLYFRQSSNYTIN